jgi:hypothetical protein
MLQAIPDPNSPFPDGEKIWLLASERIRNRR